MGVRTLAINCFPDYVQTDPWWRREMCMSEADATKMLVNERWYLRRGYEKYKEQERYPYISGFDGRSKKCMAVFMRKALVPP